MDLDKLTPLVIYDNQCYLCTKFAQIVNLLARGKLLLIGHYSEIGETIRKNTLDQDALKMFWLIDRNTAYGGRAALIPLFSAIIKSRGSGNSELIIPNNCIKECKNVKSVFVRSASLFTNSRKISISRS
jgi:hypothetical protein